MTKSLTVVAPVDYLSVIDRLPVSDETRKTYRGRMAQYLKYCTVNGKAKDLDSLLAWLRSIDNPSTLALSIAAVKSVMGKIYRHDPRLPDLTESLDAVRPASRMRGVTDSGYLKKADIDKLIRKAPENVSLIMQVLFWTGLRVSEMCNIRLADCKESGGYIEIKIIGKGLKENVVYMSVDLFQKCRDYFGGQVYLICNHAKRNKKQETKYHRAAVWRLIDTVSLEILEKHVHPHTFRHSKAMYLKDVMKLSVDQVQKALGHSSATTTIEHYFHGRPDAKSQGIK
jgi:integrase/recombinase XerD